MNRLLVVLGICFFFTENSFGQTYVNPTWKSSTENNLTIKRVVRGDNSTTVDFEYVNGDTQSIYIYLTSPNTSGAIYIQAGYTYKLISTQGIANKDGVTIAYPNTPVKFSAVFEAIPKTAKTFNLIEPSTMTSTGWSFYGVQIVSPSSNETGSEITSVSPSSKSSSVDECSTIRVSPASSKPSFYDYMAGVKIAVCASRAEYVYQETVLRALKDYLLAIGFNEVIIGESVDFQSSKNICDYTNVKIAFDNSVSRDNAKDILLAFESPCGDYNYTLELTKSSNADGGVAMNTYKYFYNAFVQMYNRKPPYSSRNTIKVAQKQTCWTESRLRSHFESKDYDYLEGVYESSVSASYKSKYRLGVKKIEGIYYLIYLSGAYNTENWKEGDVKATLEATATPLFFKAKWVMQNKSENDEFYVSFENGLINLIYPSKEKELYIKLLPSVSNDASTPSITSSSGTGYAISSNGYIVTNHHVTNGSKSVKVRGILGDFSKSYHANVILEDRNNDLSIIKIEDSNFSSLGQIPYIISNKISDPGSSIFVLGYPLRATMGDEVKLTNGIISSKSGYQGDITSYQITAPVQPGNSGGPLFDDKGNVIGIVNAKHIGAENVSYAIKASYLLSLLNSLPSPPKLQTYNSVAGKSLPEQVKVLQRYTYIIEVN